MNPAVGAPLLCAGAGLVVGREFLRESSPLTADECLLVFVSFFGFWIAHIYGAK